MQGTQYATKRSILCRGAFCGPTVPISNFAFFQVVFVSKLFLLEIRIGSFFMRETLVRSPRKYFLCVFFIIFIFYYQMIF